MTANNTPDALLKEVVLTLPVPLLVMDGDLHVLYLNDTARQLVDEPTPLQVATRCGDVLQCLNALRPGECCGETEECPSCVVRQTVTKACQEQTTVVARAFIRRDTAKGDRYVNSVVKASGFTHDGELLVTVMLQDIPEIIEAAGLLRLCAWCHKVSDDTDRWTDLSEYLARDLSLEISHGMCPDCSERWRKEKKTD